MIFVSFFAEQARVPQLSPLSESLVFRLRVKLPQLADPEAAGPEKSLLRPPFTGLIVAFGKEPFASLARGIGRGRSRDSRLEFLRGRLVGSRVTALPVTANPELNPSSSASS